MKQNLIVETLLGVGSCHGFFFFSFSVYVSHVGLLLINLCYHSHTQKKRVSFKHLVASVMDELTTHIQEEVRGCFIKLLV